MVIELNELHTIQQVTNSRTQMIIIENDCLTFPYPCEWLEEAGEGQASSNFSYTHIKPCTSTSTLLSADKIIIQTTKQQISFRKLLKIFKLKKERTGRPKVGNTQTPFNSSGPS